jgi:hypothetical protein
MESVLMIIRKLIKQRKPEILNRPFSDENIKSHQDVSLFSQQQKNKITSRVKARALKRNPIFLLHHFVAEDSSPFAHSAVKTKKEKKVFKDDKGKESKSESE